MRLFIHLPDDTGGYSQMRGCGFDLELGYWTDQIKAITQQKIYLKNPNRKFKTLLTYFKEIVCVAK